MPLGARRIWQRRREHDLFEIIPHVVVQFPANNSELHPDSYTDKLLERLDELLTCAMIKAMPVMP
jgi:hypothetical protein